MAEEVIIEQPEVAEQEFTGGDPSDKTRALYDKLYNTQLYTKTYDEFKRQYSTPEAIHKLYSGLAENELYTKSKDDFINQYFPTTIKARAQAVGTKVKIEPVSTPATPTVDTRPMEEIFGKKAVNFSTPTPNKAKLEQKAKDAGMYLFNEMQGNRDVKEHEVRQRRFEQQAAVKPLPRSDMPRTQSAIDVSRYVKQRPAPQELPVTDEDIAKEDFNIQNDRGRAVRFLENLSIKRPEKAKDIQKNIYLVDAYHSLGDDQKSLERTPKIQQNAVKIKNGSVVYDPRSGILMKPQGFFESLITGRHELNKSFDDYDFFTSNDRKSVISKLEGDLQSYDPDDPIPVPDGIGGEAGALIGGNPIKALVAGGIASLGVTALGNPEVAPQAGALAGSAVAGTDFYKMGYANALRTNYYTFRRQGIDPEQAYDQADKLAKHQADVDALTAAGVGLIGLRTGLKPTISITNGFKHSVIKGLTQLGEQGAKKSLEGLGIGLMMGTGQAIKNIMANQAGVPTESDAGVKEQISGGIWFTIGAALLGKAFNKLTKPTKNEIMQGLSKVPEAELKQEFQSLVDAGQLEQPQADALVKEVQDHRAVDQAIPDNIPEAARLKIQDKIKQRNELEERIKSTDKAFHEDLKEKVKKLNEDILELAKPEEKTEAGKTIDKAIKANKFPEVYREIAAKDPEGFLKFIADQSFGRDENGTIIEGASAEPEMRLNFSDELVDKAKELYPLTQNEKSFSFEPYPTSDRAKNSPLTGSIENGPAATTAKSLNLSEIGGALSGRDASFVKTNVLPALHNDKIFDAIVRLIPIEMMDDFAGQKISPQELLHNKSMFLDVLASNENSPISIRLRELTMRALASLGAELSEGATRGNIKFDIAGFAESLKPAERDWLRSFYNSFSHASKIIKEGEISRGMEANNLKPNQDALRQSSAASEIPYTTEAGKDIPIRSEGVRPSQQGEIPAGTRGEEKVKGDVEGEKVIKTPSKEEINKLPLAQRKSIIDDIIYGRDKAGKVFSETTEGGGGGIVEQGYTVAEVLEKIKTNGSDNAKKLANHLLKIADKESLKVKHDISEPDRAYYSLDDDAIHIGKGASEKTVMHEILHALTSKKLPQKTTTYATNKGRNYLNTVEDSVHFGKDKNIRRLINIYKDAVQKMGQYDFLFGEEGIANNYEAFKESKNENKIYGLLNLDEFLSQAFTDGSFQKQLQSIKTNGVTLWERFVAFIADVLGIDIKPDLLSEVIYLGDKIISSERKSYASKSGRIFEEGINIKEAIKRMRDIGFTDEEMKHEFNERNISYSDDDFHAGQAGAGIPPPSEQPKPKIYVERPATELSHKGLQDVANEFSLPDVQVRERKSDIQLRKDAEITANDWREKGTYAQNIEGLVKDAEAGKVLTDEQRVILEQHLANVSDSLRSLDKNSQEFNEQLKYILRLKEAGEKTRSEAGAALRLPVGGSRPEATYADFMAREAEVSGVAELTEQQKAQASKEFEEISAAKSALEEKVAKLEAANAKLKAEKTIEKARAARKPGAKKDYKGERRQIIEDIREKLKKARGETSIVAVPYAKELIAIAPDVAKLVKNLVEEGIEKLPEVVRAVHDQLKDLLPEITETDVHNIIAGEYNAKQQTKSELTIKLENLRIEAKLINRLEELEKGAIPKDEKKKIKRNREIEELRQKIKDFKKEQADGAKENKTPLDRLKERTKKQIEALQEQLKNGDFAPDEKKAPIELDDEAIKLKNRLIELKQEREKRLAQIEYEKKKWYQKALDATTNILGVPRSIMASFDFSAPLRQGLIATVSHPSKSIPAFAEMFKQAFSQKRFDRWLHDLKESPQYQVMEQSGLYVADPNNLHLSAKEEAWMSNLAEKIPVVGRGVKGSERAYVAYLNKLRVDIFNQGMERLMADGKTPQNNPELYQGLANFINHATGRGKLGALEPAAQVLNTAFFSPRLIASRVNLLNPLYYTKLPKEIRIMALKDMAKTIGFGLTILGLAKAAGADVEEDPRSPDFGKMKFGNTRYDVWGGFQQYVRVASQLITGATKSSTSGKITDLTSEKERKSRADVAIAFMRGKLSPVPGTVWDFAAKKDVTGKPFSAEKKALDLFTPMIFNDTKEAWKDQGFKSIFTVTLPSSLGVGISTYGKKK